MIRNIIDILYTRCVKLYFTNVESFWALFLIKLQKSVVVNTYRHAYVNLPD